MENSSFVQVMKDWRRMCKAYTTDDDSCCDGCPVVDFHEHGCGAIFEMEDSTNWQRYADTIRAWAAEYPEPVYPTWGEWLLKQGVIRAGTESRNGFTYQTVADKLFAQIDTDIAQKLGIEPKEGV